MEIKAGAQSAYRKLGLQFEHAPGGGFGCLHPPELSLRSSERDMCKAPIGSRLDSFMRRFRRCLILAALKATKRNCQQRTLTHRIERTQSQCALTPFNAFVRLTIINEDHTSQDVRQSAGRAHRESRFERLLCRFSIVRHEGQDKSSNRQCDGVITAKVIAS